MDSATASFAPSATQAQGNRNPNRWGGGFLRKDPILGQVIKFGYYGDLDHPHALPGKTCFLFQEEDKILETGEVVEGDWVGHAVDGDLKANVNYDPTNHVEVYRAKYRKNGAKGTPFLDGKLTIPGKPVVPMTCNLVRPDQKRDINSTDAFFMLREPVVLEDFPRGNRAKPSTAPATPTAPPAPGEEPASSQDIPF